MNAKRCLFISPGDSELPLLRKKMFGPLEEQITKVEKLIGKLESDDALGTPSCNLADGLREGRKMTDLKTEVLYSNFVLFFLRLFVSASFHLQFCGSKAKVVFPTQK